MVLANPPPLLELQAKKLQNIYNRKRSIIDNAAVNSRVVMQKIKEEENRKLIRDWRDGIRMKANTGRGFNLEILSCMEGWIAREYGELMCQMTQLITEHGSFRGYTHRIGKTEDSLCKFCGDTMNDNIHVIFDCPQWREDRKVLMEALGGNVHSLGALLRGIANSESKWNAVLTYANKVMTEKSETKRKEEQE